MTLARDLVSFAATALFDVDGRPVAEVASPAWRDVPTELVACPYADVRAGQPMNRTALRQMSAVWPALLASFAALGGGTPTVHGAWAAALSGIALPLLAPRPVPRLQSALFKASLGLSQVFSALLLSDDGVADAPLTSLGDGAAFFAELDRGRWLVGADQVCAGTAPMIEQVFDALTGRIPVDPAPPEIRAVPAAPVAVGLHVAHLLACQQAARRGEREPVTDPLNPWLRAVFAVPNRPVAHARRLFEAGAVPAAVERYLASPGDEAFTAAIDAIDAQSAGGRPAGAGTGAVG
jgi:hypothetical protein